MKIATLLFTYHRSWHTEQVITSLKNNMVLPQKLFVFQDGIKNGEDTEEWEKVNALIHGIDWCSTEIIVSKHNKGLAASIVEGIAYAFEEYEAVIVLEDDCVAAPSFISFMQQCFEKYQNNKKVFSVSGYAYPVSVKEEADIYGCGRISSWGWGTWKSRWDYFNKDYELARKMKQEEVASRNLATWGRDLESMLIGNIRGECNSWAVFWALNVIAAEGICINPYQSLIKNIGLDGSGEHCGDMNIYGVEVLDSKGEYFNLPDDITIFQKTIVDLLPWFGNYTAINQDSDTKEKILVYGLGNFYLRNERDICETYYIEAFVDQRKHDWFAGKRIIKKKQIEQYKYDRILIMIQDEKQCMEVEKALLDRGIAPERILIGRSLYAL